MGKIARAVRNALLPWTASATGDATFELLVAGWFAGLVCLRALVVRCTRSRSSGIASELQKRPTIVPVMLHSLACAVTAAAVLILAPSEPRVLHAWRRGLLPFSTAYWLFDLTYYCYPKADWLVAVHHMAVLVCNYPVGDLAGAAMLRALNPACDAAWWSAHGYALEATTFLLYTRWLLAHALTEKHRWVYTANNLLLLASWVGLRLVQSPYVLIADGAAACVLHTDLGFYTALGYATYSLIILMSLVWLMQLLQNGLHSFLVLDTARQPTLQPAAVLPFGGATSRYSLRQRKGTPAKRA